MVLAMAISAVVPASAVWPGLLCLLLVCVALLFVQRVVLPRRRFTLAMENVPGPKALPIIGNSLILTAGQDEFFRLLQDCATQYGELFVIWVGLRPFVFIQSAEACQPLLNSSMHIDKSYEYGFLNDWVGTGLITSSGSKWHARRKLLTPSFHNKVMEDFASTVQPGVNTFIECLGKQTGLFDIVPLAKLCTLDLICDTVMGQHMDFQRNTNCDYVEAISEICSIVQRRFITPWLKPEALFKISPLGIKQKKCVEVIHRHVDSIIEKRKKELEMREQMNGNVESETTKFTTSSKAKYRVALLDLLLEMQKDGLTNEDIREEANTFMFAGHDTSATAVSWCLYVLGKHPDVQDKIVEEVLRVKSESADGTLDFPMTQKLHYLDCCIREVMRLYPVAPLIARDLHSPLQVGNHLLPAGVTVLMNLYLLHRDPRYFPEPDKFKPERFMGAENTTKHPFAYIPFSAGSRNCIGQRFAMMQLKIIMSEVLCNYIVHSPVPESDLNLLGELVLVNKEGIQILLTTR
ncbi:cytochrome P450 4c3 [Neocloeon triangulifer]|uniref:cytochrome P450 4c3 n=1 Tax=Neocloeon triangulifer TaxID=2078957 RepID=UPI00286EF576|nr:cytochrome P450 4c3 [Neocloeon triangulifer]